jgi:hypothetical protein
MNESQDAGAPVDRLAQRVALLGTLLALTGGIVVGLGVWGLIQTRDLGTTMKRVSRLSARLDRLDAAQASGSRLEARSDKRLTQVEDRIRVMWGGVRRADVNAVRAWVARVERQVEDNASRLDSLSRGPARPQDAARDSLGAVRMRPGE